MQGISNFIGNIKCGLGGASVKLGQQNKTVWGGGCLGIVQYSSLHTLHGQIQRHGKGHNASSPQCYFEMQTNDTIESVQTMLIL